MNGAHFYKQMIAFGSLNSLFTRAIMLLKLDGEEKLSNRNGACYCSMAARY